MLQYLNPFFWIRLAIEHDDAIHRMEAGFKESQKVAHSDALNARDRLMADKPIVAAAAKPTTTLEENLHTAGARKINLIWEFTQAFIAFAVTVATLWSAVVAPDMLPAILGNAFFLVIGFYFGRTNHARTGGMAIEK